MFDSPGSWICVICQEGGLGGSVALVCGHVLHEACLLQLVRRHGDGEAIVRYPCPTCRVENVYYDLDLTCPVNCPAYMHGLAGVFFKNTTCISPDCDRVLCTAGSCVHGAYCRGCFGLTCAPHRGDIRITGCCSGLCNLCSVPKPILNRFSRAGSFDETLNDNIKSFGLWSSINVHINSITFSWLFAMMLQEHFGYTLCMYERFHNYERLYGLLQESDRSFPFDLAVGRQAYLQLTDAPVLDDVLQLCYDELIVNDYAHVCELFQGASIGTGSLHSSFWTNQLFHKVLREYENVFAVVVVVSNAISAFIGDDDSDEDEDFAMVFRTPDQAIVLSPDRSIVPFETPVVIDLYATGKADFLLKTIIRRTHGIRGLSPVVAELLFSPDATFSDKVALLELEFINVEWNNIPLLAN